MTILGSKFLKKSLNRKPKLVAFKYRIAFATILAADFNCDQFRIMSDIISKNLRAAIAAISCQVVLFHPNLSRRPFLGQVVDWDLLLCTRFSLEHADLFLSYSEPMNDRKIDGRNEHSLVGKKFLRFPLKISFHFKKTVVTARNLQIIKIVWLPN